MLLYPWFVNLLSLCTFADTSRKAVKVEPSCPGEPVATTQSESGSAVSNTSDVKSKPLLKKLTIPLKAIPTLAPHRKKLPGKQPISSAISRYVNKQHLKIVSFCYKLQTESFLQWKIVLLWTCYVECLPESSGLVIYFLASWIISYTLKAWKRETSKTLNLVRLFFVPFALIKITSTSHLPKLSRPQVSRSDR